VLHEQSQACAYCALSQLNPVLIVHITVGKNMMELSVIYAMNTNIVHSLNDDARCIQHFYLFATQTFLRVAAVADAATVAILRAAFYGISLLRSCHWS